MVLHAFVQPTIECQTRDRRVRTPPTRWRPKVAGFPALLHFYLTPLTSLLKYNSFNLSLLSLLPPSPFVFRATMSAAMLRFLWAVLACLGVATMVGADSPTDTFTWTITYGMISPLGVPQQGILINGEFPGPNIDTITNNNVYVTVINNIDEPFLITWNGIKQRKNSWQDGVLGTNCPIPPGGSYTYQMQPKDQIGTYNYFPSTALHRAAGAFGGFNVFNRVVIALPYQTPDGDFTLIIGDWYKTNHKALRQRLDSGSPLPPPDGLLINGDSKAKAPFTGDQGKTYRFRFSNVGLTTSINIRIQDHKMKVVEIEGSHVMQNFYDTIDLHVGQSITVLVTLDQAAKDYYIVASTRFSRPMRTTIGILHYNNSGTPASGPIPPPPVGQHQWSMLQARTFQWNLTANAARPNPQGSYHYGTIPVTKTLVFGNEQTKIDNKLRYAVNGVSFVVPDTPLKLADNFNIDGVFTWDSIPIELPGRVPPVFDTPVLKFMLHDYAEVVFQNHEKSLQTWHLDGNDFWVVAYGAGNWTAKERRQYNLVDAHTRHTVQVFPNRWTAILISLDNQGMWNLRSGNWARQYLGQQMYFRVWTSEVSLRNENAIPTNVILCGKATGR